MSLVFEARLPESPYLASVMHGHTLREDCVQRPAESHWHLVFVTQGRKRQVFLTGPLRTAGQAAWGADAEILWLKFALGSYMPHLPFKHLMDQQTPLPEAASRSVWLKGMATAWPTYDTAEMFVQRLVREDVLRRDPLIAAALADHAPLVPERTLRHRFLHATGLTQGKVRQMARAQHAVDLLARGTSILDTVHEAGYFDQPHLARSLRQYIGRTPAQIARPLPVE